MSWQSTHLIQVQLIRNEQQPAPKINNCNYSFDVLEHGKVVKSGFSPVRLQCMRSCT